VYAQEFASHRFIAGRAPPQPYAAIDTENSALEMPSSKPPVWAVRKPPPGSSIAARARVWEAKFESLRESPSGQGGVEDYEDPEFMQALRMAKKAAELLHSGNPNLIPKNFDKDDGKWSVPDFGIDFERSQSLPVHSSPPRILRGMPPPPPRLSSGSVATPTGTSAVPTGSARSPMTPPTASGDSTSGDSSADSSGDASGDAPSEGDRSARHSSQEWLARQCDFIEGTDDWDEEALRAELEAETEMARAASMPTMPTRGNSWSKGLPPVLRLTRAAPTTRLVGGLDSASSTALSLRRRMTPTLSWSKAKQPPIETIEADLPPPPPPPRRKHQDEVQPPPAWTPVQPTPLGSVREESPSAAQEHTSPPATSATSAMIADGRGATPPDAWPHRISFATMALAPLPEGLPPPPPPRRRRKAEDTKMWL